MTATDIAQHFAKALRTQQLQAEAAPATTPNGYGHKITMSLSDGSPIGCLVVYAGKQGPRYTTNELKLITPEILDAIKNAWKVIEIQISTAVCYPEASPFAVPPDMVELWVDGACLQEADGLRFGWAYLIRQNGKDLSIKSGDNIQPYMVPERNVAAELQAVIAGLEECRRLGHDAVTVFYDYQGIEQFAIRNWTANTRTTQEYQRYITTCPMILIWRKVPAHAGVPMNERVDRLATSAARVSFKRFAIPA